MKKNIYFLLILSSFLLFSCGKKTVIEGVVSNADSSKLVLENFNAGKPLNLVEEQLDKEGKFRFSVPALDTTEIYSLVLNGNQVIRLVVKPQEKVTVTTNKDDFSISYQVEGSEESELLWEAEQKLVETRRELEVLRKQYAMAETAEKKEELAKAYEDRFDAHHDYLRRFVFDNAPSLVSYLALYQKIDAETFVFGNINDDKYVRAVAQKMKMEYPKSPYLPLLLKELERRSAEKQNLRIAQLIEHSENSYPDLILKNVEGKELSLKNTQSKYVLLYFGVLNEATKAELLPIYNQYNKRGLQIYFVDENPNEQIWKQAVKDLNTPWINVHDNGVAAAIYNVAKLPSNYIIDVDGTIEGKDLFRNYLPERLNKLL